jgi:ribosomal protein S4
MNKAVPLKTNLPAMRSQLAKILWFFKSPSAIPGLVKVDRIRSLHRRQRQNRRRLNVWLAHVKMGMLQKLSQMCRVSGLSGSIWGWVQALEAHWPLLVTKVGWSANLPQARQVVQYRQLRRNGQDVSKVWSVAHPADVVSLKNNTYWFDQMTGVLAGKHSLMIQRSLNLFPKMKPRFSRYPKKKYNKYKSFIHNLSIV